VGVYLIGAGPGDPGLLTVRAAELLAAAEVLVHDRLVDERVLALAPASAERHDVGKRPGAPIEQERINSLLVSLGRRHATVVRLKGGDPYVFGRGGEEALALEAAGIEYEVVPGVSSVNAVPAYAGIPLTHRGLSRGYSVVTGHGALEEGESSGVPGGIDWDALGRLGGTIVVLMGVEHRAEIASRLIASGREETTPVAVVENGTLPSQRTIRTTLGELGETDPAAPAVIIIGAVAGLDLSFFERRPLFGWKVAVTRSREQASKMAALLAAAGATTIEAPTIEISPPSDGGLALEEALSRIGEFDWIAFTSANAVRLVFDRLRDARSLGQVKVAAIGRATAGALAERGVLADLVPSLAVGEELAASFGRAPAGGAVLLPQAAAAREALGEGLRRRGWRVEAAEAYRTTRPVADERLLSAVAEADAVTFASSSSVEGFLECYGKEAVPPVVCCIGPVTAAAAEALGLSVDVVAAEASMESLVEGLAARAAGRPPKRPG
jgi:uroporphyrinogen III methyltransferase/synthase